MAAMLADNIYMCDFVNESILILITTLPNIDSKSIIDNKSSIV